MKRDILFLILIIVILGGTTFGIFYYMTQPPDGVLIIMREPEHGGFDPIDIYLTQGEETKLFIKNESVVVHGIIIPELEVYVPSIQSGKTETVVVTPKEQGSYRAHCTKFCGGYHPVMQMHVHVLPPGVAKEEVVTARSGQELMSIFPHDIIKDPADIPPPLNRNYSETVEIFLRTVEVLDELEDGSTYFYWTFGGTVPGPFLRVREGDTVELTLTNDITSKYTHSIDLHAVTGQGGGAALTQVKPGESKRFSFKALNPGIYVYHCATSSVPHHMANGMYGLILVEPEDGLPPVDREYYFMQGEIYSKQGAGHEGFHHFSMEKMLMEYADYVVFNGKPAAITGDRSPRFKVGETVRLFIGNGGVSYVSSFHVIGEVFDRVYPEGSFSTVYKDVQTTIIPAGGAAIVEFGTEVPAHYILVDHALSRLERGLVAVIISEGEGEESVYEEITIPGEEQYHDHYH